MLTPQLLSGLERLTRKGKAHGLQGSNSAAAAGFDDGADVGIELGAPFSSKAVGDLAENRTGAESAFGAVVGRRNGAVGDEDEQMPADLLDRALQLHAFHIGWDKLHEFVEFCFEPLRIGFQG